MDVAERTGNPVSVDGTQLTFGIDHFVSEQWGDTYPMHVMTGISRSHALTFGRLACLGAACGRDYLGAR